jgi:hypothetical protein
MSKPLKRRASSPKYISPSQTVLVGFESPFLQKLDPNNRWIVLSHRIPWDKIVSKYNRQMSGSSEGRPPLSGRIVVGALLIKHLNNWDDRETILQIQENMYLQYFVGYDTFTTSPIFDPSLFVEIRKRLTDTVLNNINEEIVKLYLMPPPKPVNAPQDDSTTLPGKDDNPPTSSSITVESVSTEVTHHGRMITDATACPQDIAYPTDLNLLSESREQTECFIDRLYEGTTTGKDKPRTYRQKARKEYLKVAKNKNKSRKLIRRAIGKQLNYLKRNLKNINLLLDLYQEQGKDFPLTFRQQRYLWVVETLYNQQRHMHSTKTHSVEDRIVSIHQPHVRPIPRGKAKARVEFGAKIEVTLFNGFAFMDELSWDAFHEGNRLMGYVEKWRQRFGYYPKEVLADGLFSTRENRKILKELGIKLIAKPLGRPSLTAVKQYIRPGERNPIEGKFGQGKNAYGLGRIKARLKDTSQSWIASIILVLNLVKLAGLNSYCLICSKCEKNILQTRAILQFIANINALFRPSLDKAFL